MSIDHFGRLRLNLTCQASTPKAFGVGPTASPQRVRPVADMLTVLRLRLAGARPPIEIARNGALAILEKY
jgi:hypothetical protein